VGVSAANAIAIVSEKPADHSYSTRAAISLGMVAKAKTDELNLARTIWGPRQAGSAKSRPAGQGDLAGDAGSDLQCCLSRKARTAAIVAPGCFSISQ
jgi:hypothetical protein